MPLAVFKNKFHSNIESNLDNELSNWAKKTKSPRKGEGGNAENRFAVDDFSGGDLL